MVKSTLVRECKTNLNNLAELNKVVIAWVPSHVGIPGNEAANDLAQLASKSYPIGPEPFLGLSKSRRMARVKEWINREHKKGWQGYEGAKHTKLFADEPLLSKRDEILDLSRGTK